MIPRLAEVFVVREAPVPTGKVGAQELRTAALTGLRKAQPDMGPVSVYADWLQERGDPAGELLARVVKGAEDFFRAADHADDWAQVLEGELNDLDAGGYADTTQAVHQMLEEATDALQQILVLPPGTGRAKAEALVKKVTSSVATLSMLSRRLLYWGENRHGERASWTRETWQDSRHGTNLGPLVEREPAETMASFAEELERAFKATRWGA